MPKSDQMLQQQNSNVEIKVEQQRYQPSQAEMKLEFTRDAQTHSENYYEHVKSSQDSAELGSTSFKSNTEYKRKRNESINRAKKLTKKATAYTLEIHEQIKKVMEAKDETTLQEKLSQLEHLDFTPEMMYSTNIRLHFQSYISLIRNFDKLTDAENELDDQEKERLDTIKPIMELFKKRVTLFCQNNRINLNGTVMTEKQKPKEMTQEEYKTYYHMSKQMRREKEENYEPKMGNMTLDDVKEALWEKKREKNEEIQVGSINDYDTTEKRVRGLHDLKDKYLSLREEAINTKLIYENPDKYGYTKEEAVGLRDTYRLLRRQELAYHALYITAFREAEYLEAKEKNMANADEYLQKAKEAYLDLEAIFDRQLKSEVGRESTYGQSRSIIKLSRADAMQCDSVKKAFASRVTLLKLNHALEQQLKAAKGAENQTKEQKKKLADLTQLTEAVKLYHDGPREKVGYTKETQNLKDALKAIKKFQEQYPGSEFDQKVTDIKNYFDNMTNGKLQVPQGARVLDYTGQRPVNTGAKEKGWKRNALLSKVSYWSNEQDTPLFSHEPTINDIKQRTISNCYMVASVSGMVELSPDYLKKCIKDNGDGTVTVRLYDKKQNPPDENVMRNIKVRDISTLSPEATKEERGEMLITALMRGMDILIPEEQFGVDDEFAERKKIDEINGFKLSEYKRVKDLINSIIDCNDKALALKNLDRIAAFSPYIAKLLSEGGDEFNVEQNPDMLKDNLAAEFKKLAIDKGVEVDNYLKETHQERKLDANNLEAIYVKVDKEVPKIAGTGMSSVGTLWMQLIEKACAFVGREMGQSGSEEMATGYRSLWYGSGFISRLTGIREEEFPMKDSMFERLLEARDKKIVYTTGSNNNAQGVDTGHAYLIIGARIENGRKIVKLRNPYSKGSSGYDYGKGEDALSNTNKIKFFGSSDASYGQFEMDWEDFKSRFSRLVASDMSSVI